MDTAQRYSQFATFEARGNSSLYEQWCRGIASDPDVLTLIDQLPLGKRQPNLVLAAARYLGLSECPFGEFKQWMIEHWDGVQDLVMHRSTQTNEAGRAAALLPVFAQIAGPLSLIEVGASAGLCLYPDRFSYRYDSRARVDPVDGASSVVLDCATGGHPPIPASLPEVAHRAGVDLNPLDINDEEDMRWLESLVWPGQSYRLERLRAAAQIARTEPPQLVAGDLNDVVGELVAQAPQDSTVVVFGSAVLNYLSPDARDRFERTMHQLPCHWVSNEASGVLASISGQLPKPPADTPGRFVIALNGTALAYTTGHGQTLDWFTHSDGQFSAADTVPEN